MNIPSSIRAFLRTSLLVVLPTLVLCLTMLEVGLRLMGRAPSNVTHGIFEQWGHTYRLRANMSKKIRNASFSFTVNTNAYGFRDRVPGSRALGPAPYFAFVGDSATFGNGVDYDDSFVGVFARFAEPRGIDVINLAVAGHRVLEQEKLLKDFLAVAKPARVVIVFTSQFILHFDLSVETLVKDGYLLPRDNWLIPYLKVRLEDASAVYGFFAESIRKIEGPLSGSLNHSSHESPWALPATVARFEARLTSVDELIRKVGAEPVYVYLPMARDLEADEFLAIAGNNAADHDLFQPVKLVKAHANRSGVAFVDLTPALKRLQAAGKPLSFLRDPHYTAGVNHVIGQVLAETLLGQGEASMVSVVGH